MSDFRAIRGWVASRLLNAADWLREMTWLRSIYRMAPVALRQRVSFALADQSAAQAREAFSFKRLAPPKIALAQVVHRSADYGDDDIPGDPATRPVAALDTHRMPKIVSFIHRCARESLQSRAMLILRS